jgi:hypothetical protein
MGHGNKGALLQPLADAPATTNFQANPVLTPHLAPLPSHPSRAWSYRHQNRHSTIPNLPAPAVLSPNPLPPSFFSQRRHASFERLDSLQYLDLSSLQVDYFGYPMTQEGNRGTVSSEQPGMG